jgi:hypothetical protein
MSKRVDPPEAPELSEPALKRTTMSIAKPPVASMLVKRLSEKAKLPTRGSAFAAGYDLYRSVITCHHKNLES